MDILHNSQARNRNELTKNQIIPRDIEIRKKEQEHISELPKPKQ